MAEFHQIKIAQVHKETKDTVVIAFDIPEQLRKTFHFIQGQYLTLKAIINGEEVRRSYSLCSSPLDNEWKVGIKQIPGGVFSTYANNQLSLKKK